MHNTADIISNACDLRLPMSFTMQDIELLAQIIRTVIDEMTQQSVELNNRTNKLSA